MSYKPAPRKDRTRLQQARIQGEMTALELERTTFIEKVKKISKDCEKEEIFSNWSKN